MRAAIIILISSFMYYYYIILKAWPLVILSIVGGIILGSMKSGNFDDIFTFKSLIMPLFAIIPVVYIVILLISIRAYFILYKENMSLKSYLKKLKNNVYKI